MLKRLLNKIQDGEIGEVMVKKLEPNGRYIFVMPEGSELDDNAYDFLEKELELSKHNIRIAFVFTDKLSVIDITGE